MKLFLELRWTHHSITPSLQGWSLCFFRSCFRQFTSKWKMSLRRREQRPEIPGQLPSWNSTISMICQSHLMFEKTKAWSLWNITQELTKWSWNPTRVPTALDLHKSTCHVQSTEWLQWKGSADALGAVFFSSLSSASWTSLGFLYSHTTRTEM